MGRGEPARSESLSASYQACAHSLDVGNEDGVRGRELLQKERAGRLLQRHLHHGHGLLKLRLCPLLLSREPVWRAQPGAPRTEERSLQPSERHHGRVGHPLVERAESGLELRQDDIALGDHATVQLQRWEHPGGHFSLVPRLLLAVAEHGDLLDAVRHLLLLEPEPN